MFTVREEGDTKTNKIRVGTELLSSPLHDFMQTYHGEATVNNEGQVILSLPFPRGQRVEIVARPAAEHEDDAAWERMAFDDFVNGYAEEDSIYDNYFEWRNNIDSAK